MKTKKLFTLITILIFGLNLNTRGQLGDIGNFMAAGGEDAGNLFAAYTSPYVNAFGASLNGGWYNTAKPHKLGGFDITFATNFAFIPTEAQSFDVNEILSTESVLATSNSDGLSPTAAGEKGKGAQLVYDFGTGHPLDGSVLDGENAFKMPGGSGLPYMLAPTLQVGLGLFKDTEIMGRWMNYSVGDDFGVSLWGVGLKHGIKQYIPAIKKLPVLHITLMGGYTKLMSNLGLAVTPGNIGIGSLPLANGLQSDVFDSQEMEIEMSSFTGNLLVSANLPVVCFYGGAGFATTNANLKLNGQYPIPGLEGANPVVDATEEGLVDTEIKNQDGGVTKPRLNAGMRIKMGVITIHFDYTKANYSVATAGLGISFR